MGKLIKGKTAKLDNTDNIYDPAVFIDFGISSKTVENNKVVFGHTIWPAGKRNQRHYHVAGESGIYLLKGRMQVWCGPDHEQKEFIAEAGDFIYVEQGEIHSLQNLSKTEAAEIVFYYAGASNKDEAKTVWLEPPLE
jgi:uncharacterized RmlC-like cupin family protein